MSRGWRPQEAGREVHGGVCVWGWACSGRWSAQPMARKKSSSQSLEEWGQAGICQHLCIGISLHLKQHDFQSILATISFTPSKSHTNFSLNSEPFLLASCYRTKPVVTEQNKEAKWGGFLACPMALKNRAKWKTPGVLLLCQLLFISVLWPLTLILKIIVS